MSETERNLKVAKECGAYFGVGYVADGEVLFRHKELDAYTARILAERDAAHAEAICKLQEEIERLRSK